MSEKEILTRLDKDENGLPPLPGLKTEQARGDIATLLASGAMQRSIEEAFASGGNARSISNRLFGPGGLFATLGQTSEQRVAILDSGLYQKAQERLDEIELKELGLRRVGAFGLTKR